MTTSLPKHATDKTKFQTKHMLYYYKWLGMGPSKVNEDRWVRK